MKPEGSLLLSKPATFQYPEPYQSSPCPPSHFLKIRLKYYPPSTHGSSMWPLSLKFPHQNPVRASPPPIRAKLPAPLILHHLTTRIICGEEYRSVSSSLCSFLHSPVTSSLFGPNILLNTILSNTLSLVPPSMWETKFHTHTKNRQNYNSVYLNLHIFR